MSTAIPMPDNKEGNNVSTNAAPPTTTLSVLKQLRVGSTGFRDFYAKVWGEIGGSFSGFLEDPSYFILWLALIVVGSVHINDCQAEPMLPIFLVVFGVVALFMQIIQELDTLLEVTGGWDIAKTVCTYLMVSFLIGWYFTGCFWMVKMDLPSMTHISSTASSSIYDLMEKLMRNYPTNGSDVLKDQFTVLNKTMNALLAPENYCPFEVYGLARVLIYVPSVMIIGKIVSLMVSVVVVFITTIWLY